MPGYKQWVDGDVLTPAELDEYLVGQTIMRFASAAARTAALPSPVPGMVSYQVDTGLQYIYAGGQWAPLAQFFKKTVQEDVTSSTTLQDDNDCQVTLVPGTYRVELFAHASGAAAADVQTQWAFSGTITGQGRSCFGPGLNTTHAPATSPAATTVGVTRASAHTITSAVSYGLDGSNTSAIHEDLFLQVTVGGLLKLQWAQVASSGTATSLTVGSRMYVTRLA